MGGEAPPSDTAPASPCGQFSAQRHLDTPAWRKARLGKQAGLGPGGPGQPRCGVGSRPACAGHPLLVFKENGSTI